MKKPFQILGIAGSLRRESYNRAALRAAQELAPAGVALDIFELAGIPLFNEDDEHQLPARVVDLKKHVRGADAILIVTPEYNYSVPGVLKNALDWGSRPYGDNVWGEKPVAIMGASIGGFGTARAQYHLRQVLLALNMYAVNRPEVMIGNAAQQFDAEGHLTNDTTRGLIRQLLENLVDSKRAIANVRERAA